MRQDQSRIRLPLKLPRLGDCCGVLKTNNAGLLASVSACLNRSKTLINKCLQSTIVAGCIICGVVGSQSCLAATKGDLLTTDANRQQYEDVVRLHAARSHLPTQGEARMLMELNQDLFTEDAWEGMKV